MTDRLLKLKDVALILSTSEGRARKLLLKGNIQPIDLGRGRSGGLRWLESSVMQFLHNLYDETSETIKKKKGKKRGEGKQLLDMSTKEILALTAQRNVR